jgi:outer membrane protein OmpA-like peptidoglycan-associated protein
MQIKDFFTLFAVSNLLSLALSAVAMSATTQSRSSKVSSDNSRPSGFGLDIFIGGDGGYISSLSSNENESDKQGNYYNAKAGVSLLNNDLEIDIVGGYFVSTLKGAADVLTGADGSQVQLENVTVKTNSALVDISARLRLNDGGKSDATWSIGPAASALLGTNASFSSDNNANNRAAIFVGAQLGMTFGQSWKPRLIAHYYTDINLYERQIHIAGLSLQFGSSIVTPATIVKDIRTRVTDETVRTVTVEKKIERAVIKENVRILLDAETVNFETNKANLLKRSDVFLRELGLTLAQNKDKWSFVTIEGHTDSRGSLQYNNKLSLTRAYAVREVLLRSGIPANRVKAVGYGPLKPLDPSNNQLAWARNRRVELSFQGVDDSRWLKSVIQKLKNAVRSLPQ